MCWEGWVLSKRWTEDCPFQLRHLKINRKGSIEEQGKGPDVTLISGTLDMLRLFIWCTLVTLRGENCDFR